MPYVFPIPTWAIPSGLPPCGRAFAGLFLASSANIVNGTLNVNETVSLAHGLAPMLLAAEPSPAASGGAV